METEKKKRSIQEYVPGKQVTLAHIIAKPKTDIYIKLGLDDEAADAIEHATKVHVHATLESLWRDFP